MKYATGQDVNLGDEVKIEKGRTSAVVEVLIKTSQEMSIWNVDEPGVFLKSKPFGLVYWPESQISTEDPILLVKAKTPIKQNRNQRGQSH